MTQIKDGLSPEAKAALEFMVADARQKVIGKVMNEMFFERGTLGSDTLLQDLRRRQKLKNQIHTSTVGES